MKAIMFSAKQYDRDYFTPYAQSIGLEITFLEARLNDHTVHLCRGYDTVIIFVNDAADAKLVAALAQGGVKLLALRSAGFNHVDLQAARQHDIKVVRVPAYSPEAVAEHTMALILTLNRKVHKAYNRVREGNFSLERLIGFNLHGRTVGVVGTGKIGKAFAKIALGFGCTVIAYDPTPDEGLAELGVRYEDLPDVLAQSDILSLHCPLMASTKYMIHATTIAQMKPGVMLINTSRGALIETTDVIEALKSGHIGYLGIDVYEQEEHLFFEDLSEHVIQDDEMLQLNSFPNVLITAHQAFFTTEAMTQIAHTTCQNIEAYQTGKPLVNEVN